MWTDGVPVEDAALDQVRQMASLAFIHKHLAIMPDVHAGRGSTVGTVIPTKSAIVPAAVGVDIGCGMIAVRLDLRAEDLPDTLAGLRSAIEAAVPHGRTGHGDPNQDKGAWDVVPEVSKQRFFAEGDLARRLKRIAETVDDAKFTRAAQNAMRHLGTLGTGNHFVEVCLDENDDVWVMIHSGSRGIGNAIGRAYIEKAKEEMRRWHINLPDQDLAYLPEGSTYFDEYIDAMLWAQDFAALNRRLMLGATLGAIESELGRVVTQTKEAIDATTPAPRRRT